VAALTRSVRVTQEALELQILFLIDVSASVDSYREGVASQIESVIESVRTALQDEWDASQSGDPRDLGLGQEYPGASFEVGVVGFYDVAACNGAVENYIIDFSSAVGAVGAEMANNLPDPALCNYDVADDLAQALSDGLDADQLSWSTSAKHLVYLLTDAPAHGSQYWDETALATEDTAIHDLVEDPPAGTIEDLIGRYCDELDATVYLLDLLWHGTGGNYTSQMYGMVAEAHGACIGRARLTDASEVFDLLSTTITGYATQAAQPAAASTRRLLRRRALEGSSVVYSASKPCPAGHYCVEGADYPTRCGAGLYTAQAGSSTEADCQACPAGAYCRENDNVARYCPKGHYCPEGAEAPSACPESTYNVIRAQDSAAACLPCPPGSSCDKPGIADYADHLCAAGHYCDWNSVLVRTTKTACPVGTASSERGADDRSACGACRGGYSCPEGSLNPEPCQNGTYCLPNSALAIDCSPGTYCPALSEEELTSPAAFQQPDLASDFYQRCPNGTYCGAGATEPTTCPTGYVGSGRLQNVDEASGCTACDPGWYVPAGATECVECEAGYVCQGATEDTTEVESSGGRRALLDDDQGYTCPPGYYCPSGAPEEQACPVGTYQPLRAQF